MLFKMLVKAICPVAYTSYMECKFIFCLWRRAYCEWMPFKGRNLWNFYKNPISGWMLESFRFFNHQFGNSSIYNMKFFSGWILMSVVFNFCKCQDNLTVNVNIWLRPHNDYLEGRAFPRRIRVLPLPAYFVTSRKTFSPMKTATGTISHQTQFGACNANNTRYTTDRIWV